VACPSGLAVFESARQVFGSPWKAAGFALLLEATNVASRTPWLAVAALLLLVNAATAGVRVALEHRAGPL
jgi:hypothetical protein